MISCQQWQPSHNIEAKWEITDSINSVHPCVCYCICVDILLFLFDPWCIYFLFSLFTDRFIQAPNWRQKSHPSPDVGQSPVARSLAAYRRPYKQFVQPLVPGDVWKPSKNRTLFFCKPWKQKNRTKSPSAFRQRTQQPFPAFSSAGAKARASFCASQHAESTQHQTELI